MFFFLALNSCVNDLDNIAKLSKINTSADEISDSLTIIYTDSAKVKVILFGQIVEKFHKPNEITKIKNGLRVLFFDENERKSAILTSQEGEIKEKEGTLTCKYNVVFKNLEKEQTLYTEELNWDKKKRIVFTPENVTIQKGVNFLYGEGLEANEDFSWYKIIKPTAKVNPNKKTKNNETLQ